MRHRLLTTSLLRRIRKSDLLLRPRSRELRDVRTGLLLIGLLPDLVIFLPIQDGLLFISSLLHNHHRSGGRQLLQELICELLTLLLRNSRGGRSHGRTAVDMAILICAKVALHCHDSVNSRKHLVDRHTPNGGVVGWHVTSYSLLK